MFEPFKSLMGIGSWPMTCWSFKSHILSNSKKLTFRAESCDSSTLGHKPYFNMENE